ncbi:MarR family transcriptional regulator [Corticibacter populi]|uniref:MarR family transcriptional regulator n=1 Tax=Corticibacter populi TaxID=1550736 RepID=A0A3M6QRL6_9BURK|nr:winged helix DNA-binding protein [Corticibacter populi]RMX05685.1 MarR family transcriptional regulator [Corticibacter populi]RZS31026.1 MarR family transcriptional regulator [Corticibacter populi]
MTDKQKPEPYDFTAQVGHLLRRAYQRHTTVFQQHIPDSHLTAIQFVVLCALRDHGGSSIAEIVRTTVIDQATIRGVIERLRARELVAVEHDREDRRKVVVQLTASGARMVEEMVPFGHLISERTFGCLNPAERLALLFLLQKMIAGDDAG